MADDGRDRFYTLPSSLNAKEHSDFQQAYLLTLAALMYHVNLEPANDFFSRCYPLVLTIQSVFGQGRRAVFNALAWLKANDYFYNERRGGKSSIYTVILRRERFRQVKVTEGLAAAITDYEAWIEERRVNSRAENVEGARVRARQEGNSHLSIAGESKYPTVHLQRRQGPAHTADVHSRTPMGVREAARVLKYTQNKIHEIRRTRTIGEQDSGFTPPEAFPSYPEISLEDTQEGKEGVEDPREAMREFLATVRRKPDAPD